MSNSPRISARAIIVDAGRLLLVNSYPAARGSALWCAPGGGAERHTSLAENLIREVHEETGLLVDVGSLALVDEFHEPEEGIHQVNLFFRCRIAQGVLDPHWRDPDGTVHDRRFFAPEELEAIHFRPISLGRVAFDCDQPVIVEPLRIMVT